MWTSTEQYNKNNDNHNMIVLCSPQDTIYFVQQEKGAPTDEPNPEMPTNPQERENSTFVYGSLACIMCRQRRFVCLSVSLIQLQCEPQLVDFHAFFSKRKTEKVDANDRKKTPIMLVPGLLPSSRSISAVAVGVAIATASLSPLPAESMTFRQVRSFLLLHVQWVWTISLNMLYFTFSSIKRRQIFPRRSSKATIFCMERLSKSLMVIQCGSGKTKRAACWGPVVSFFFSLEPLQTLPVLSVPDWKNIPW